MTHTALNNHQTPLSCVIGDLVLITPRIHESALPPTSLALDATMSSSGVQKIYEVYGTRNNLLFNEENILDYRPGGYHPVALGDAVKDGRYIIRHKLGYGGFSTVWVARDKESALHPRRSALYRACADIL